MEDAVRKRCNCPFSSMVINSGEMSCPFVSDYNLSTHLTYRAILNGTSDLLPASRALEHIQDWVGTEGSFRYYQFRLRLADTSKCKLSIKSFREKEC